MSLLAALPGTGAAQISSAPPPSGGANQVCDQFMSAMKRKDWQAAFAFYSKNLQDKLTYKKFVEVYEGASMMVTVVSWKADIHEHGQHANGKISVTSAFQGEQLTHDDHVDMVLENGQWKIDSYK